MECDNVVIILSMAKSFRRIPSYYGIDMPIHHVFFSSDFSLLSPNVFNRYDVVNSRSLFSTAPCSTIHSTWRRTMPRCMSRSRRPIPPCNSSFSFGSTRSLASPVTTSAGITYRRFPGRCSTRVGVGMCTYLHIHVTVFVGASLPVIAFFQRGMNGRTRHCWEKGTWVYNIIPFK